MHYHLEDPRIPEWYTEFTPKGWEVISHLNAFILYIFQNTT